MFTLLQFGESAGEYTTDPLKIIDTIKTMYNSQKERGPGPEFNWL